MVTIIRQQMRSPVRPAEAPASSAPGWLNALTPELREMLWAAFAQELNKVEELRLRVSRPLILRLSTVELTVCPDKSVSRRLDDGFIITGRQLEKCVEILSQNSVYAYEDEFVNGYLTIPGGHRVGLAGRIVLDGGRIKTIKEISGLNYRIGRQITGCADKVIPFILEKGRVCHTLIVSPPQCGKTTILRDIVRQLSDGVNQWGCPGVNVGLVDERSEIAGVYQGEPQFEIGLRTDVLDACPKARGMMMLLRAMSPRVIATDEIGRAEDVEALEQMLQAGVSVITTVHGNSMEELLEREALNRLLQNRFFERLVFLSRRLGAGTVEAIYNGKSMERLC